MRHEYYCEECVMMCRVRMHPATIVSPKVCVLDKNRICDWKDDGLI